MCVGELRFCITRNRVSALVSNASVRSQCVDDAHDESFTHDLSVIVVKVNALMHTSVSPGCVILKHTSLTCVCVWFSPSLLGDLQQSEGGPCGHEQRREEALAGEVSQHEQAGGYQ